MLRRIILKKVSSLSYLFDFINNTITGLVSLQIAVDTTLLSVFGNIVNATISVDAAGFPGM